MATSNCGTAARSPAIRPSHPLLIMVVSALASTTSDYSATAGSFVAPPVVGLPFLRRLCPEVAEYLKAVRSRPPAHLLSIKELRRDIDKLRDFYPPEPVHKVEDRDIPGLAGKIRVRIYTPEGKGPFPLAVFYHGGGWCIGSLNGYDGICAIIANKIPAVVLSVDYRLAPENSYPAAFDDCYSALKYAADAASTLNADPSRIAVMGDSAGANLAAVVSLKSKLESGPRINLQILVYPATNLSRMDSE